MVVPTLVAFPGLSLAEVRGLTMRQITDLWDYQAEVHRRQEAAHGR